MKIREHRRVLLAAAIGLSAGGPAAAVPPNAVSLAAPAPSAAMTRLLDYVRGQNTTGFLVIQDGRVLAERNWPAPRGDDQFSLFVYGHDPQGALLEDVASQQKSFVSVLVAVAVDKGLLDIAKPVSDYIGKGWSKATSEQEAAIRVIDVLTMSSGLDEKFAYVAPPETTFFYNTPVYAVTKRIVAAAAKRSLDAITHDWLTAPLGMQDTGWRKRPAALAGVGNDTGLVTSPRDIALFGGMILDGGVAKDGTRIVSPAGMKALFTRAKTNPAYGRLWWLNGGSYAVKAPAQHVEGPLIPAAPADLVGAFGAFDRRLYVVPSRKLIVVRTGATARDADFDQQVWLRLMPAIG